MGPRLPKLGLFRKKSQFIEMNEVERMDWQDRFGLAGGCRPTFVAFRAPEASRHTLPPGLSMSAPRKRGQANSTESSEDTERAESESSRLKKDRSMVIWPCGWLLAAREIPPGALRPRR